MPILGILTQWPTPWILPLPALESSRAASRLLFNLVNYEMQAAVNKIAYIDIMKFNFEKINVVNLCIVNINFLVYFMGHRQYVIYYIRHSCNVCMRVGVRVVSVCVCDRLQFFLARNQL